MRTLSVAPALFVTALLLSCDAWSHVGVPPDIKHPSIETPGAHTPIANALSDNTGSAAISKEECIRFFSKRAKDDARLICSSFRFSFVQDAKPWEELDHVVVETGDKIGPLHACLVAKLIRDTEALLRTRFLELRFEKLQIEGTLHLN